MDGVAVEQQPMLGARSYSTARCDLRICDALPKRMHQRTRELVALEVPAADRRKGYARELLEQVTTEADEHGLTLIVMPDAFGDEPGMSTVQLAQWYQRRFGFLAIQAKPLIMARMPGSTPRHVLPIAGATRALLDRLERRK